MTNEERIEAYRKMIADREAAVARMQLEISDIRGLLVELGAVAALKPIDDAERWQFVCAKGSPVYLYMEHPDGGCIDIAPEDCNRIVDTYILCAKPSEYQNDVQAASGGLAQTPQSY